MGRRRYPQCPITRSDVERAVTSVRDAEPVSFDVWYFGQDDARSYANLNQINWPMVVRVSVIYPRGSRGCHNVGGGDWSDRNRLNVRRR